MAHIPETYEFSAERGFLPMEDPETWLAFGSADGAPWLLDIDSVTQWQSVARDLPHYVTVGMARNIIRKLPPFPMQLLTKREENIEHAMRMFSFLGHAYVFGGENTELTIPRVLAEPWHTIAQLLNRPPVLSYASYALYNWQRLDIQKPITLDNIAVIQNFGGGIDENWFVLVHVDIEAKAGKGITVLYDALDAAKGEDIYNTYTYLDAAAEHLSILHAILKRMPDHCNPYIYYNRVRPYIQGWKHNPSFPNGIVYEGCFGNVPQQFRGETGAQSSILPALDALLGIPHNKNDSFYQYLTEMRDYMPYPHRMFLKHLESNFGILRNFVIKNPSLHKPYLTCVESIFHFRAEHLQFAENYIARQVPKRNNSTTIGTGGTPFIPYLKKHKDDTFNALTW